jgi:acyl-coenzyme A synthetase/AMP-(fatty) acid ligase/thioesterase domain-containing protein
MINESIEVFPAFTLGGIRDVKLGCRWDSLRLGEEIDQRAAVLAAEGIGRGSVVAIIHGGTARFFADLLATWKIGATATCLDQDLTAGEVRNVVEFSKAVALLTDGAAPIDGLNIPVMELAQREARAAAGKFDVPEPEEAALVLFTSGTTGIPKGVVLSFGALRARIEANIAAIGKAALRRALVTLPTHFGHGLIGNSLTPLLAGGDIVLHPLGVQMANSLGRIVDDHEITFVSSVPSLWRMALPRSSRPRKGTLSRIHIGSAPLPATLWSQVVAWSSAEVVNCYGTTETANWIAGASSRTDLVADGLIGSMWGGRAAVLDDNGAVRESGSGEILIRSPSLMSGYLARPDLSSAALHDGWYRTGDSGSIDQSGRLWLTGRIKDEINRAGFKVQPAEIDALLETHLAIAEACVFGISDPLGGEAIAAAVRLENGANVTSQQLHVWCLERVRREAIPESWFFVSEIPRTRRGKVSREVVRKTLFEQPASKPAYLGTNALDDKDNVAASAKRAVELAWSKVFGTASWAANTQLSDTGGDSLDAMRLWLLIEQALGRRLLMDVLDADPKPSEIAAHLERQLDLGSSDQGQVVFLMTPAEGDSPGLAHFRSALGNQIRFSLIKYPDWRNMIDAGSSFEALVEAAVHQICEQTHEHDSCYLAGYSFGGFVAMESARRLADHNRHVSFLGLIDTRTERPTGTRRTRKVPVAFAIAGKIMSALIRLSAFRPLKLMGQIATLLPAKSAFTLEFMLNARLRTRSLGRFQLKPLNTPVTLFRSDEGSLKDNGWGVYCNDLTIVPIGGDHHSILAPPYIDLLNQRFLESLEQRRSRDSRNSVIS